MSSIDFVSIVLCALLGCFASTITMTLFVTKDWSKAREWSAFQIILAVTILVIFYFHPRRP